MKPSGIYLLLALAMGQVGTSKDAIEPVPWVKSLLSLRDGQYLEKLGVSRRDILKLMKTYGVMVTHNSDHSLVDLLGSLSEGGVKELAGVPGQGLGDYVRGLLEKGRPSPAVKRKYVNNK